MMATSHLLRIWFWPNFKGSFPAPSLTIVNCQSGLCPGCESHDGLEIGKGPGGSEEEALGDDGGGDDLTADPELFDKVLVDARQETLIIPLQICI